MEKARKEFEKLNKKIDYLTDKMIDKLDSISREIKRDKAPQLDDDLGESGVQSIRIVSNKENDNE